MDCRLGPTKVAVVRGEGAVSGGSTVICFLNLHYRKKNNAKSDESRHMN